MGTPDFAAVCLDSLIKSKHEVLACVCQPDKPRGRGHKLTPPEVKVMALENDIAVYQPTSLRHGELDDVLDELKPEVIVVAAYGKILPNNIIDYPRYGCINVHGSLLPKYRGAAPIQRSVLNGDDKTGITTMYMDYAMDTGDILDQVITDIGEYETSEELFDRLAVLGAELLLTTLDKLEAGTFTRTKQNDDEATYAGMITKDEACIDWSKNARSVINLVCGMNSWPMAFTTYNGETVKVIRARMADGKGTNPGEIISLDKGKGLKVSCGDGCIYLTEIQASGSKRMNVEDYLRGHSMPVGTIFGVGKEQSND